MRVACSISFTLVANANAYVRQLELVIRPPLSSTHIRVFLYQESGYIDLLKSIPGRTNFVTRFQEYDYAVRTLRD
jgi:hypothetical protein